MRTSALKPPNVTLVSVFNSQEDKVFACFFLGDKKKHFKMFYVGLFLSKWACRGQLRNWSAYTVVK